MLYDALIAGLYSHISAHCHTLPRARGLRERIADDER